MRLMIGAMSLAAVVALCARAEADPWKDESGHGRGGPPPWAGRGGEPPDWARGKGVWDGHFKHGHGDRWRGGPPSWAGRGRDHYRERYDDYRWPHYGGFGSFYDPGFYGGYQGYYRPYGYGPHRYWW